MTLSAILLAGGLSRRMGVDKATLLIGGEPLWRRQLGVLGEMRPRELWASAGTAPPWCPPDVGIVVDAKPSRGPLSGVAAGLRRMRTSHLLVLAVDLPRMTAEHQRKLWGLARPGFGIIPRQGDRFEPLCAFYPAEAVGAAEGALASGDASLQRFARELLDRSEAGAYDLAAAERPLYLNMNAPSDLRTAGAVTGSVLRVQGENVEALEDALAIEEPLEIQLSYTKRGGLRVNRSVSVTMRTPGFDEELAAGFLFTEGILTDRGQIEGIAAVAAKPGGPVNGNSLCVRLKAGVEVDLRTLERHFYTTSSCGVCGKTSLEALRTTGKIVLEPGSPLVESDVIAGLPQVLRRTQAVFDRTGGLHGAALFDREGALLSVREDIGRHNAVDKVIGCEFMNGRVPLSQSVLLVSGRASFELMQKAVMAGVPILAAVGAPSSLAVELARQFGATLVGFVRDGRFNVYAGADRIRQARAGRTLS